MKKWKAREFYEQGIVLIFAFTMIIIGFIAGSIYGYLRTKDLLYDEMVSENKTIWVRIEEIGDSKIDLMTRLDKLARAIEQYDLAIAQLKVYERRKEISNICLSKDD